MRLIIITQIVDPNDERRGFFVKWIEELAKSYDEVKVITFKSRDYKPPLNVKVCHLGDHFKGWNLLRALKNRVQKDDHVLAHMSPIYAILAWPFVLLRRGKIGLWYAHRSFTFKLWLAHKLCSFIFTATPESTQLKGAKVKSIGHAIDLDQFHEKRKNKGLSTLKLLTVGRITPIKEYEIMINALAEIEGVELKIVGGVAKKEDEAYLRQLRKMIEDKNLKGRVEIIGAVPYSDVLSYYREADGLINLCSRGALDKVLVEAMACGLPVLTSNQSAIKMLPDDRLAIAPRDVEDTIRAINDFRGMKIEERAKIGKELRGEVEKQHDVKKTMAKMIAIFNGEK